MMAKPIRALELHYPMIQFLIKYISAQLVRQREENWERVNFCKEFWDCYWYWQGKNWLIESFRSEFTANL